MVEDGKKVEWNEGIEEDEDELVKEWMEEALEERRKARERGELD